MQTVKEQTKKISFDLYKEGKSVTQIAEERKLSVTTIESHLAYYVGKGEIPVSNFVSQELLELISGHFEESTDLFLGPVKAALEEDVSWSDIRFVASHIRYRRSLKG